MVTWALNTSKVIDNGFGASRHGNTINGIIIHHAASSNALNYVAYENSRSSHPTYHIANNGIVTGIVSPVRRPYSTAHDVDMQAITVEIDNETAGGSWPVSDLALKNLVELIFYTARERGFTKAALSIRGVDQSEFFIGWHSQYIATACPGPYIINRLDWIVSEVNKLLSPTPAVPVAPPVVVKPPVIIPPVVEPPTNTEPPVIAPPVVVKPPIVDIEPTVESDPFIQIDLDRLSNAMVVASDNIGVLLPIATRKRVYTVVQQVGIWGAAVGTTALAVAPVIGGELGGYIAIAGGVIGIVGSAFGGAAGKLAKMNT